MRLPSCLTNSLGFLQAFLTAPCFTDPDQRRGVGRAHRLIKKSWGALTRVWVPHDVPDVVVDFVRRGWERTEIGVGHSSTRWARESASSTTGESRHGRVNEHNGWIPPDFWLAPWEKQAIIAFHQDHPLEGFRPCAYAVGLKPLWSPPFLFKHLQNRLHPCAGRKGPKNGVGSSARQLYAQIAFLFMQNSSLRLSSCRDAAAS
jgi:hypothetical protein